MRQVIAAAAALAGAACTSMNAAPATFEGTRWQVTAINGHATPATDDYAVRFSDGRIGGRVGCNNFGASYHAQGDILTAGEIAATEMHCSGPAGQFESWGFMVLGQPMRMTWHSDRRLMLSNNAGSIALELQR